jgi:SAM-dependent methyltransferase
MEATPNAQAAPDPGLIFAMAGALQQTSALFASIELDVFAAIGKGPGDVASIARHCSASERGIRILCDFLVINGLLQKVDGHYKHTPTSALFLDPASPASIASVTRFMSNPEMNAVYSNLAEVVRTGRTTLPGDGSLEPDNPLWVTFAENMAPMMRPIAGPIAALVLGAVRGPVSVLDIAAGHGLFGIEIAKQNPEARITGQDWAQVLDVAQRNAHTAGVADRYSRLPGSAFEVEFGGPYDAVLLTNFLHHFDYATCVSLLKKVHAALRPGGVAATLDFVPDESRVSPPMPAGFAMTMLTSTVAGDVYPFSELLAMYTEAGFSSVTANPLQMSPETVVLGHA